MTGGHPGPARRGHPTMRYRIHPGEDLDTVTSVPAHEVRPGDLHRTATGEDVRVTNVEDDGDTVEITLHDDEDPTPTPQITVGRETAVPIVNRETRKAAALADFLDTFDGHTLSDLGPHMTCTETNVLAELLRAHGADDTAAALLEGHASEDEEGDDHYQDDRDPAKCAHVFRGSSIQCASTPAADNRYCSTHAHLAGE